MSTIQTEDWSDINEDYPYFIDTFDKTGRPSMKSALSVKHALEIY